VEEVNKGMLSGLEPEEREALGRILRKLVDGLMAQAEKREGQGR
jgi:hypothetical protein